MKQALVCCCVVVLTLVFLGRVVQADLIEIENPSFEKPETASAGNESRTWNWNDQQGTGQEVITGWNYDYEATGWPSPFDTATFDGLQGGGVPPVDGVRCAYVRHSDGGGQDTGIWQELNVEIISGFTYTFSIDVAPTWDATDVRLMFNGHADGERELIVAEDIDISGFAAEWTTVSVSFTAAAGESYLGKNLGIEFNNTSAGDSWASFDNVTVEWAGRAIKSRNVEPVHNANDVLYDTNLSWIPGEFAVTHDVYLGVNFDDVNNAGIDNPLNVLVSQSQDVNTFDPGHLDFGQTYYWRVDEVNGAPDYTVFKGDVWSFTVEPLACPIETVIATSDAASDEGAGPENTVNGSGLNADDQHSTESSDMWVAAPAGDEPVSIAFEFDRVYQLHEMLVWNYNVQFELLLGFGVKTATVEYSTDGIDWATLGEIEVAQATAAETYTANTAVNFGGVVAQYVRLTVNSGYGMMGKFGLSEVRFFYVPVQAREPEPAIGDTTDSVDVVLSWRAGREAASHEVYLGTDANDLALFDSTNEATLALKALNYNTTYYWSVIEVNDAEDPATYAGDIWTFTTPEYIVVDDFETYNDDAGTRIFDAWVDGWGIGDNGSQVGYGDAPFAEKTIVNSGSQSMPLAYDNVAGLSEATLSLDGEDWTVSGIKSLLIAVYGQAGNTGQLYVKINGTKMSETVAIQRSLWLQLEVDLSSVSAALLRNVTSVTLGVEGAGAAGMLYVDDVRLGTIVPVAPLDTTPIAVENASFELPGGEGRYLFNDAAVPGWSVDEPVADSGVELDWSNTDGGWGAFLMNGDPAIWQLTDHTIAAGKVYELKIDAAWPATTLRMTLYYDVNGARIPAATCDVAMDGKLQEYALVFTADDVPDAIGTKLGIEFSNVSAAQTWAGLDYVTLGIAN